jgi:hypothetical protein
MRRQRQLFLLVSGLSTMGSFAGLTAKAWVLMDGTANPMLLALHFALLSLPTLVVSGPAGVVTDREGCEPVLIRAQWGLFAGALLGAAAIPLSRGPVQAALLLLSTLVVGVASAYELTARNKYCALLVESGAELGSYLTSFSLVFNIGKLIGPPVGGWLVTLAGPGLALLLDALSYLLPILAVLLLLRPDRTREQRSRPGHGTSLGAAWRLCGAELRHVLTFTGLFCLVGFFHPGLAPLMARTVVGPRASDLGLLTSVVAAGSISGGVVLQRWSGPLSRRPGLLLGSSALLTAVAQMGMGLGRGHGWGLAMAYLIGAGTAVLLSGCNLVTQVAAPQVLRGRMAGLGQIAFLGGGGLSGLLAASLSLRIGLGATFTLLGAAGGTLAAIELMRHGRRRLPPAA